VADALYEDYRERGVIPIHVVIEDCPTTDADCSFDDNDVIDWKDAHVWAYEYDTSNPKDGNPDPFQSGFPVIADVDGSLWSRFSPGCTGCGGAIEQLLCLNSCQVTTQTQILDRGFVTVDDTCHHDPAGTCTQCVGGGYNDAYIRSVLDSMVPVMWCGEATD